MLIFAFFYIILKNLICKNKMNRLKDFFFGRFIYMFDII